MPFQRQMIDVAKVYSASDIYRNRRPDDARVASGRDCGYHLAAVHTVHGEIRVQGQDGTATR